MCAGKKTLSVLSVADANVSACSRAGGRGG